MRGDVHRKALVREVRAAREAREERKERREEAKANGRGKSKGKGKGYQGACWRCGKVGHKAAECATCMDTNIVETSLVGEGDPVDLGGIRVVGSVNAQ